MTPSDQHNQDSEEAFLRDWLRLLDAARDLRARAARGRFVVPTTLRVLVGEDAQSERISVGIPEMKAPPDAPKELKDGWIWVSVEGAQIRSVVRAILRSDGRPMSARKVVESLKKLRGGEVSDGTVANIGTALDSDGVISRQGGEWILTPLGMETSPLLHGKFVYGPPAIFLSGDIAWFRRAAIHHILRLFDRGLQAMQVVDHIERLDWVPGPKGKDIVKMDLEALREEGAITRGGGQSKKWVVQDK